MATSSPSVPNRPRSIEGARVAPSLPGIDFDPTYGYDLARLLTVAAPAPPADFDAFWARIADQAAAVDTAAHVAASGQPIDGWIVRDVTFTSLDGVRIGGWLAEPARGPVERGLVVGHGYGGRDAVQPTDLAVLPPRAAAVFACARGLSRSRLAGVGDSSDTHVLAGIDARETYVHRGCVADQWCAARALIALVPGAAGRLDYLGGSFGGGIGAMALAHAGVFAGGVLKVPSFGAHPLRLRMRCTGSGESVRRYGAEHPEVAEVLRYFDAASAATRVQVPTLVAPALADPAVPPPGQFAVANAMAGPTTTFVLPAGHAEHPDVAAAETDLAARTLAFWG